MAPDDDAAKKEGQSAQEPVERDTSPFALREPGEGGADGQQERERLNGVFSTQSINKVGTGTTVRRTIQKSFWMCEEQDDGSVEIQPLNANYIPSGPKRRIAMDDLLQKFSPEPEFYVQSVFPALQELNQDIDKGEEHRKNGESLSAEHRFKKALAVDVDNVRANFGLGLTYLERGEADKADNIFDRLVRLDAAFEPEHKHLFNEFGINLRKNKMIEQALSYYGKALSLSQGDENLHYNIARAHFEKEEMEETVSHLRTALNMNPELDAAAKFMEWMQEKGMAPGDDAAPA